MGILQRLVKREPPSRDVAKERLQLVLVHDRQPVPPDLLETIKDEIILAISRHVDIDRENAEVAVSRGKGYQKLVADIPILNRRRSA
jgi:cell division topological specificity factor